ncbi:MAG: HAMP domain-containing sensor histidine kinase [Oligoflexia bacterium]|nr:HAMP domain-containing sensor histidine kinase [Oligoflexia bacterium]
MSTYKRSPKLTYRIFETLRTSGIRTLSCFSIGILLVWAGISGYFVHRIIQEKKQFFNFLVDSNQEIIAAGQWRPFFEGLERDTDHSFKNVILCWNDNPASKCKTDKNPGFSYIKVEIPVLSGPNTIAFIRSDVSIQSAIELTAITLLFFIIITGITFYVLIKFKSDSFKIEYQFATSIAGILENENEDALDGLPEEVRPLGYAMITSLRELMNAKKKIAEDATDVALAQLASQVSHDIRSPLAALLAFTHSTDGLDERSKDQLRSAVNRIRDIANNLLAKGRERAQNLERPFDLIGAGSAATSESRTPELLAQMMEAAVSQKRLQFSDHPEIAIRSHIDDDAAGLFSEIRPLDLDRILSNLMNNAIEAMERNSGEIDIALRRRDQNALISVRDNGKGISAELLSKVIKRGGTFGKADGNGLGLSHAKATVEAWGGSLKIESEVEVGTTVWIEIPFHEAPAWFADVIRIERPATVVVLDDDRGIHDLWKRRLKSLPDINLLHFDSPEQILTWFRTTVGDVDHPLYLCDYEFHDSKQTGLDIVEMLGIASRSLIVTGRSDELELRKTCAAKGLKLLPKAMAGIIPIQVG